MYLNINLSPCFLVQRFGGICLYATNHPLILVDEFFDGFDCRNLFHLFEKWRYAGF